MGLRTAALAIGLTLVCAASSACARPATPSAAPVAPDYRGTQTVRHVSVTAETTTTQASQTPYSSSGRLFTAKPGYRLASVICTAVNSTDATVAVPNAPVTVRDTDGTALQGLGGMRIIWSASGEMVQSRLIGHRYVGPDGMALGGTAYYIVSYQRPSASRGPVTVVCTLGGGRTYTFTLASP